MSTSRFSVLNYCADPAAYVANGVLGTAPVRTEVSPYLMERVLDGDRQTVWKCGAGTFFDLALDSISPNSVGVAAVLGMGNGLGDSFSFTIRSRAAYDGGVPGWTSRHFSAHSLRDMGTSFSSPVTDDFWRFEPGFGGDTAGTFWLGPLIDLGILYSPSSSSSPRRNRLEQAYPDGSRVINELGPQGRTINLAFEGVRNSTRSTLEALADVRGSFVYLDPLDRVHEVILAGGEVQVVQNFIDSYSVRLTLEKLP